MRYIKKPIPIEAFKLSDLDGNNTMIIPGWVLPAIMDKKIVPLPTGQAQVFTDTGCVLAERDDWILRGVKGELYPCKPDVFKETYDLESEVKARKMTAADVVEALRPMKDDARAEFIDLILDAYCEECGSDEGHKCNCMKDD